MHSFLRSTFLCILHTTTLDRRCTNVFLNNIWNDTPFLFFLISSYFILIFGLEVCFLWWKNYGKSPSKYGSHGKFPHCICALIPTKHIFAYHYFRLLVYMFFLNKDIKWFAFPFLPISWSYVILISGLEVRFFTMSKLRENPLLIWQSWGIHARWRRRVVASLATCLFFPCFSE